MDVRYALAFNLAQFSLQPLVCAKHPFTLKIRPLIGRIIDRIKPFVGKSSAGFTLVELMVSLAIGVIVLTLAIPSFSELITNNRLTSTINNLVADMNLARTEAIKRNSPVVMCRSGNPVSNSPVCCETNATGCTSEDWSSGWLVYAYGNNDVTERSFDSGLGDELIKRESQLPGGIKIKTNSIGNNWLIYGPTGAIREASAALYGICNDPASGFGRRLVTVSLTGRANIDKNDSVACDPA